MFFLNINLNYNLKIKTTVQNIERKKIIDCKHVTTVDHLTCDKENLFLIG